MKFSLGLGFVNGMVFASSILWLFFDGLHLLPILLLILSSFVTGLLLGEDSGD